MVLLWRGPHNDHCVCQEDAYIALLDGGWLLGRTQKHRFCTGIKVAPKDWRKEPLSNEVNTASTPPLQRGSSVLGSYKPHSSPYSNNTLLWPL